MTGPVTDPAVDGDAGEVYVVAKTLQLTTLIRTTPPEIPDTIIVRGTRPRHGLGNDLPHERGATVIQSDAWVEEDGRRSTMGLTIHNTPRPVVGWIAARAGRRFLLDSWTRVASGVTVRWTGWVFTPDVQDTSALGAAVSVAPVFGQLMQDVHGRLCSVRFTGDWPPDPTHP